MVSSLVVSMLIQNISGFLMVPVSAAKIGGLFYSPLGQEGERL
jgi:hypothetical protein